ncbi:MAG TPA: twitching motility protein PilT [Cytophagales bacterium]|nr:twitching motility protein PilT [Cytophagales bacterium]
MSVAYVDANVFVYAFLKTKRALQPHEVKIKDAAKKIVTRINEGEKVVTSVVHFSEICNILDDYLPIEEALLIERGLLFRENILICDVSKDDYLKAVSVAEDQSVGINDALAYVLMKKRAIQKVYSFDKDFDAFADIRRTIE